MAARVRFKIGKAGGDGMYDWAVFDWGHVRVRGCCRSEALYWQRKLRDRYGVK